jgi:anti-anti-sigma factor
LLLNKCVRPAGWVECRFDEDLPHVDLTGEIDMETAPQFDAAHAELLTRTPSHVVVNLAGVSFLSCAGLAFVDRLNLHLGRTGHRVWIVSPSPAAARVLDLTGFSWDARPPTPAIPGTP